MTLNIFIVYKIRKVINIHSSVFKSPIYVLAKKFIRIFP